MTKRKPLFYRFIRWVVQKSYYRYTFEEKEVRINSGNIYISNHAQIHGPLAFELYFPDPKKIWVIGEICSRKTSSEYAMQDFWPNMKKGTKWLYWLFSKLIISWLGPYIINNSNTIPVYKDIRLRETIRSTVEHLIEGQDIIIFPEYDAPLNKYINDFQKRFVDIAQHFNKREKRPLYFYPVYICPNLKKIIVGRPTQVDASKPFAEEKARIITYLQTSITNMADSLPSFTIIPYRNI